MNQESQSCCPVCTLYLRPGISLRDHLKTHSKRRIKKALLTLTNQTSHLPKSIEQSEGNLSGDSSSTSSVSNHSTTFNSQDVVNKIYRNSCPSPKSQKSHARSELRDALEDDYLPEFEEDQPDGSISYQGESNESTQHHMESEETGSSMTGNFNNDQFQSNGHVMEDVEYMPGYFYSSENAPISHTDPDHQLNPPQYSTLTTMELHPEYLSSNSQEHQSTLDIQTDEHMPAHGELSGQESLEPPEPILVSIWTMKSVNELQPHTRSL